MFNTLKLVFKKCGILFVCLLDLNVCTHNLYIAFYLLDYYKLTDVMTVNLTHFSAEKKHNLKIKVKSFKFVIFENELLKNSINIMLERTVVVKHLPTKDSFLYLPNNLSFLSSGVSTYQSSFFKLFANIFVDLCQVNL